VYVGFAVIFWGVALRVITGNCGVLIVKDIELVRKVIKETGTNALYFVFYGLVTVSLLEMLVTLPLYKYRLIEGQGGQLFLS
jgi:hypothetical protein